MSDPNRRLVVMVEDDQSVRKAMTRIFRIAGMPLITYRSAEDLLADRDAGRAACLILDVQLPGLTGFELHERLLKMGTSPTVIFISAFDEPEAREQASRAGALHFLAKPFAGRQLVDIVRQAIDT
jgi:FixJ family two-component response regulator